MEMISHVTYLSLELQYRQKKCQLILSELKLGRGDSVRCWQLQAEWSCWKTSNRERFRTYQFSLTDVERICDCLSISRLEKNRSIRCLRYATKQRIPTAKINMQDAVVKFKKEVAVGQLLQTQVFLFIVLKVKEDLEMELGTARLNCNGNTQEEHWLRKRSSFKFNWRDMEELQAVMLGNSFHVCIKNITGSCMQNMRKRNRVRNGSKVGTLFFWGKLRFLDLNWLIWIRIKRKVHSKSYSRVTERTGLGFLLWC